MTRFFFLQAAAILFCTIAPNLHSAIAQTGITKLGTNALYANTTGDYNSAFGYYALRYNTAGSFNTAFGNNCGPSTSNLSNTTALGSGARTTASIQVRLGEMSVTSIGGYANWSKLSDGRFKQDIQQDVPGLEFITQLRPVTYTVNIAALDKALGNSGAPLTEEAASKAASAQLKHTGFIAQEVEEIAKKLHLLNKSRY